ncbi:MAG TPA: amino acid adenylation domain-containing protein, partial [Candidatus Kapabacteria bacterium]|nr:amino acid adenylation domain-containing protein [Candidatus Kapabacteria bacterium]
MNNVKTRDMLRLAANQKLKEKNYWLNKLSGDLVKSSFPFDYKQPWHEKSISRYENPGKVNFNFSGELYEKLMQLSKSSDTVLHMVLTAGLIILIEKYTGNHDIIVGSPIYKQDSENDFLNTITALRTILKDGMTFKELLGDVRKTIIEAHENLNYPIEILSEQLNLPVISENDFPLFDIVILIENIHDKRYIRHIHTNIVFSFFNTGNQITGTIKYAALHYDEATIKRIVKHFNILFERVLPALDTRISLIDILTEDERKQLLFDFNDTGSDCPKDKTLIALFAEQVEKNPNRIAIVGNGTRTDFPHVSTHVSYKELNNKSNRLGHLLQSKGVGPDNIVGILVDRSIEMMIMILGVLKSGGAYLPIETETPLKRLSAMLDDCGVQIILTTGVAAETYPFTLLQNIRQTKDIPAPLFTGLRPQITELDRLPIPDRGLVNYEQYHKFIGLAPVKHAVSIQGTRGCPYNCLYCHKIWPKKHVFRSAENIFEEIRQCYQHGIKRFAYVDDILNLNIENSSKLFALIIKNKMKLQMFFPNGVRGDILTESYIDLMMEAGTIDLMMALESASPRIQTLVRKNLNLEKFEKNLQYIIKHYPNVNLEMNIMVGFPTETEEEALMSLEFLERHKWIHFPNLNLLKIYPNTDMYHLARQNGISDGAITRSADLAYHQLPETLPFSKNFTHKYQTRFLDEYFLAKERLLYVLPYQMKILTEDELVQKYDSYLPVKIKSFSDILEFTKISKEELGKIEFLPASFMAVPNFTSNYRKSQPSEPKDDDAYRILFLDLSLFFSKKSETELYAVVEPPLGFLYLLTDLNRVFKNKINGKIIKSNIDFDNYEDLKILINEFKPDLIGIRTLSYYKEFFHTTVSLIRQWGIEAPIIAGGPYATSDYAAMLMDYKVNLAVLGEGELTLRELVEKIFANNRKFPGEECLKDIQGIAFVKNKDKALLKQKKREIILLDNLDLNDDQEVFFENPKTVCQENDLSYVVFTSGSTGIPKGTLISNRNVVRVVKNTNYIDLNKEDRVLQLSNYAFDGSVFDIYGSFLNSATLVLVKKEDVIAADYLAGRIKKEAITVFFVTTALFNLIADIEIGCMKNVRKILFGGERVSVDFVKKAINYLGKNKILHMYGPTETTVYATAYSIEKIDELLGTVPIGGPISETQIHILDNNQKIIPIGVVGEIYIGGIGVSRGYLNRPEITAEKFIENPYLTPGKGMTGNRLYRTGDLACWLKEGIIEFIGRIDHQVKIRGFRIELGEIENILLKHPHINEAVVIVSHETVSGFQDKILCAYIVSNQTLSMPDLKEEISNELPPYMVPTYFMQLNKIPLTANGKVDRKALPNPTSRESNKGYIPPENDEEIALVQIWSEALGIEKNLIGIQDDFFQIGGQSLKVMILISKIHEKLNVKVPISEFFKSPTIKALAVYIKNAVPLLFDVIQPVEKKEYYPITPAQKRLYILQQMEKNSIVYNVPLIRELVGKLDLNKFTNVFNRLIMRHESLRTFFSIIDGNIMQRLIDWPGYDKCTESLFSIDYYEFRNREEFARSGLMRTLIKHFDLAQAPLMRASIIKIEKMSFILVVDMHHIIMDGFSLGLLLKEFNQLYKKEELAQLRVQYKDFSEWRVNDTRKAVIAKQEQYWLNIFPGEMPVLHLPFDYPRPPIMSFAGDSSHFTFAVRETELLNKIAADENTTMFITLLTLFNTLMRKISGQDDIIVGTVTAGRDHADLKSIIGMFVNTIPLRNHPQGEMTFKKFLSEVKNTTLKAFENQDYPFEELVEKINIERDVSINPMFDVMFILQNFEVPVLAVPGLEMKPFLYDDKTTKFNLTMMATESEGNIFFSIQYNVKLFSMETIERLIGYFKKALYSILENREISLSQVEIIPAEEKNRLLNDFNNTHDDFPFAFDRPVYRLFEEQVERTPDHTAVFGSTLEMLRTTFPSWDVKQKPLQITYRQLNEECNQIAVRLIEKAVQPNNIVAVMVDRSIEMITGILGILKTGSAYLPLDPGLPTERINYMLKDAGIELIIDEMFFQEVGRSAVILPKASLQKCDYSLSFLGDSLAYIIYTSGTTGRPKGILVKQKGILNLVLFHKKIFPSTDYLRASQTANQNFDAMSFEIWPALTRGAVLYITPNNIRVDPFKLKQWLINNKITASFQSTAIAMALLDEEWPESGTGLKILWTAGDKLTKYLKHPYPFRFFNLYGPTEDTVWTTWTEIEVMPDPANIPSIGKPIANHTVYIVDTHSKLQPVGAPGELCIGGIGLAEGYLNRPDLTAEKFDPDLWNELDKGNEKNKKISLLYRTGDLAKWRPNGNIEFLGRIDQQVKIRGFRIELGEIESLLANHKGIKEVIVVTRQDVGDENYLCAYLVSDKQYPLSELQKYLARDLPAYMIPSYFVYLEKIPLTPNGKVDRKKLPKPELKAGQDYIPPTNSTEVKLIQLWAEVLNIQPGIIGIDRNFFELGGHSLRATVLASIIHKELNILLPLSVLFKIPTIRGLSEYITSTVENNYESIIAIEECEYYGLSFAQKRMYILQQVDLNTTTYNMPEIIPLPGEVAVERLTDSFKKLLNRHESLRTSFHLIGEQPMQKIHREVNFEIEIRDESHVQGFVRAFDLSCAPLLRVGFVKTAKGKKYLLVDMHHIISDGISNKILKDEFMALYEGKGLPALRLQYKDFAQWQNSPKKMAKLQQQMHYWLKEFAGEIPVLELPLDYPRPVIQSFEGNERTFEISSEATRALNTISLQSEATLFMTLTAVVNILLSKLSGQEEIIIGIPIAGRQHADLEKIIGIFVNTIALKNYPIGEINFTGFLGHVKKGVLMAYENQDYPFEDLVDKLSLKRDMGRNPLFEVMFTLQNMNIFSSALPSDHPTGIEQPIQPDFLPGYGKIAQIAKFDLTFSAAEVEQKIVFSIQYCTKLFNRETIERFITYFQVITLAIINEPGIQLKDIDVVPGKEKEQLLYIFNKTRVAYHENKTIHELFEEQASKKPDNIAVFGHGHASTKRTEKQEEKNSGVETLSATSLQYQITYRQLNNQSNLLLGLLIQKGVLPNNIVGIMMERSIEMIIGLLGILKSGAAYLPIDPNYPQERIDYMLKDSGVKLLAIAKGLGGEKVRSWEGEKVLLESIIHHSKYHFFQHSTLSIQHSKQLAYIIYTSGSTGNPKGVMVEHQAVVNLLFSLCEIYPFSRTDTYLFKTSFEFDVSVSEIFGWFLGGGRLAVLESGASGDPQRIMEVVKLFNVTHLNFVPSMFAVFVDQLNIGNIGYLSSLKYIFLAGETILPVMVKRFRELNSTIQLENLYGPTEGTVYASWYSLSKWGDEKNIPIGKPIHNIMVYIFDNYGYLNPVGIRGELYIAGKGVARGYLNRPELTAEKFIHFHPSSFILNGRPRRGLHHSKLYRTGDLARWLADGNIEFLGRMDHQVKIRGFRIELEEIENRISRHPAVKEAVVLARQSNEDKYLCAYIVLNVHDESAAATLFFEIREFLTRDLPDYMIPSYFVPIDKIPLTPNGKVDKRGLPEPGVISGKSYMAPRDTVEAKLAAIWGEILFGINSSQAPVGIDDNFFQMGGHSLKAVIMLSRVHRELNVKIPLAEIFRTPTIKGLADYVRKSAPDRHAAIEPIEKREYYGLSSAQKRLYILQQIDWQSTAYNIPEVIPLGQTPDLQCLEATFQRLIERHESLRTSFHLLEDHPVQKVHAMVSFKVEERIGEPVWDPAPFDLSKAPLLRAICLKTRQNQYYLMVDMHHIISDGISHAVLRKDFMSLYQGKLLTPLKIQYKDFSEWQNSEKEKENLKRQESYWVKTFPGEIPVLEIATDFSRPMVQGFEGKALSFVVGIEETRALKELALKEGATLFIVLLSLYNIFLARLSGQEDIIIGTPTAGRRHADLEPVIGVFINTLALRNYPGGEKSFREFLREVKEGTIDAFENQDYPFEDLVEKVATTRDASRNPLFDVMLVLQNMDRNLEPVEPAEQTPRESERDKPGIEQSPFLLARETSKFDLVLNGSESNESNGGLNFSLAYSTRLFKQETAERFLIYLKAILMAVLDNPDVKVSEIDILPVEEKKKILFAFNSTGAEYPWDKTIDRMFAEQAEKMPDQMAVIGSTVSTVETLRATSLQITYRQLNEQSKRLACLLIEKGVQPDTIVGIIVERSVEMIVGILGILKAGGAYMPIDPDYPRERIDYMLKDSGTKLLVTNSDKESENVRRWEGEKVFLEYILRHSNHLSFHRSSFIIHHSNHLAYIIYTSGTTGKPKGVLIENRNLVNYVCWFSKKVRLTTDDRAILTSSFGFDLGYTSIYPSILSGSGLHIVHKETYWVSDELLSYIRRHQITYIKMTPSLFSALVQSSGFSNQNLSRLRLIVLGGEPIKLKDVEKTHALCRHIQIMNHYGPTETTIGCVAQFIDFNKFDEYKEKPTIGYPIDNMKIFILDKGLNFLPIGVPGELIISGSGVGRGYTNHPELTAEKFVGHPDSGIVRMYRTGDVARWTGKGTVEFLGRSDNQVKIRGFRVELGEIESRLLKYGEIKNAVVLAGETPDEKYLCAYIVSHREYGISEISGLRESLAKELPDYMIPSYFVQVEKIPLTSNRKIDLAALPKPVLKAGESYILPRDEIERKLLELWSEILARDALHASQLQTSIGIDDNFFQLGGHSLKAVIMLSRVHRELNVKIPLAEIFRTPTIKGLADYV